MRKESNLIQFQALTVGACIVGILATTTGMIGPHITEMAPKDVIDVRKVALVLSNKKGGRAEPDLDRLC